MRLWSCLLLLSFVFPISASAQAPVIPHSGETIEVSIVNVDTVVTDRQGHRVRALRKDDFEIYENGVRQPITNFAEYASAHESAVAGPATSASTVTPPAEPPSAALPPPPLPRTIIVFVERFQLPSFRSDPVFAAVKELLHKTVRPGDRVVVVSWNHGILGIRQDFTDDLARIDKAIDFLAQRTTTIALDDATDLEREIDSISTFEQESLASTLAANRGHFAIPEPTGESGLSWTKEMLVRSAAKKALLDEKRKVTTLNALMRSTGSAEGKKVLLLATHRLSMYAGAEGQIAAGVDQLSSDFRMEFDAKALIRSLIETANANGFTIYPIYPEGLGTNFANSAEFKTMPEKSSAADNMILTNETVALEYVAKETGGLAAWGSSDVTKLLPGIGDDFDSYYSLAYRATPGKAATRRIQVKVKDPKLIVRARTQYLPKPDATRMDDRVIATLFGNAPPSSFEVKVTLGAPKLDASKQYIIPVTMEIPISALTTLPGPGNVHNGAFTVYMAFGAVLGGISDTHRDTKQFSIADKDLATAKAGHYTYQMDVAAATPNPRIALGVYDEVSKEYSLNLVDLQPPVKDK